MKRSAEEEGDQDLDTVAPRSISVKRSAEEDAGGEAARPRRIDGDMDQDTGGSSSNMSRKRLTDSTQVPGEEPAGVKQRIMDDTSMDAIEVMEERIGAVKTRDGEMPMVLCEENIRSDQNTLRFPQRFRVTSFQVCEFAPLISEFASLRVRDHLHQQVTERMLWELYEEEKDLGG